MAGKQADGLIYRAILLLLELIVLYKPYIKQACPSLNSLSWLSNASFEIKESLCVLLGVCVGCAHWCYNASMAGFMIVHQRGPMERVTWVWSPRYLAQTFRPVRLLYSIRHVPPPGLSVHARTCNLHLFVLLISCRYRIKRALWTQSCKIRQRLHSVLYTNPTLICYTF